MLYCTSNLNAIVCWFMTKFSASSHETNIGTVVTYWKSLHKGFSLFNRIFVVQTINLGKFVSVDKQNIGKLYID